MSSLLVPWKNHRRYNFENPPLASSWSALHAIFYKCEIYLRSVNGGPILKPMDRSLPLSLSLFLSRWHCADSIVGLGSTGSSLSTATPRMDVLVSMNASSATFERSSSCRSFFFSSREFPLDHTVSPPPFSSRHCLPLLLCSSLDRARKKRNRSEDESKTSPRLCR